MVLVHGFGAASALFYRVLAPIMERVCVVLHDMIGYGGSSRPDNYDKHQIQPQESIDYFVESIEKWRIAVAKEFEGFGPDQEFTDFYLFGHSLGGYMVGNYALKYP